MKKTMVFGLGVLMLMATAFNVYGQQSSSRRNPQGNKANAPIGAEEKPAPKAPVEQEPQKPVTVAESFLDTLSTEQQQAIAFDPKQKEPIFIFDYSEGEGIRIGPKLKPHLQIFADGRVVCGGSVGGTQILESKLSNDELMQFLNLIVNQHHIYELKSNEIKKIAAQRKNITTNALNSKFAIQLKRGKHTVVANSIHNLISTQFEQSFLDLFAIYTASWRIRASVHLAGKEKEVIKAVNVASKKVSVHYPTYELSDLKTSAKMANGRFQARFGKISATDPTKEIHALYFVKDSKTEPAVTFYQLPIQIKSKSGRD